MESVAVITGANACVLPRRTLYRGPRFTFLLAHRGIGFAVARRLLQEVASSRPIRLCLACRNIEKAEAARQQLLSEHPEAQVDLLQVDVGQPQSAIAAAREIQKRSNSAIIMPNEDCSSQLTPD